MPADPKPEDWSILGVVPRSTTKAGARAAYLARAAALHPDRHPDAVADERVRLGRAMAALNEAWDRIEAWPGWEAGTGDPEPRTPMDDPDAPPGFHIDAMVDLRGQVIRLVGTSADLRGLAAAGPLPYRGLRCTDRRLEDADLAAAIGALPDLRRLDLDGTGVGDGAMAHVSRVRHLGDLQLSDTAVTDDGLRAIAGLQELRTLALAGTAVTDAGLGHLAGHPTLAVLNLRDTAVEGPGLASLGACPALRLLALPRVDRSWRRDLAERRPDVTLT